MCTLNRWLVIWAMFSVSKFRRKTMRTCQKEFYHSHQMHWRVHVRMVSCHHTCVFANSWSHCNYWQHPSNTALGSICHISPLLRFYFWRSVYFNSDDSNYPSNSREESGRFVCINKKNWHDMTFAVLKIKDNKVISRNKITLTGEPSLPNIRTDHLTAPKVVKSRHVKTMM